MRILGIDPALNISGFGVIDDTSGKLSLVKAGIIRTKPKDTLSQRLDVIHNAVLGIVQELKPDCMVLEKVYVHYRHQTTAFILGQARGVICLVSAQTQLPLFEYAATRVKKALVGQGLASKAQVQRMVMNALDFKQLPKHKDITDALALAIAHNQMAKSCCRLNA